MYSRVKHQPLQFICRIQWEGESFFSWECLKLSVSSINTHHCIQSYECIRATHFVSGILCMLWLFFDYLIFSLVRFVCVFFLVLVGWYACNLRNGNDLKAINIVTLNLKPGNKISDQLNLNLVRLWLWHKCPLSLNRFSMDEKTQTQTQTQCV